MVRLKCSGYYQEILLTANTTQIWNLLENENLFRHSCDSQGTHDPRAHIAEMVALFGPPPKTLIDREVLWNKVKFSYPISNEEGKPCLTARELFKGPFFDSEGILSCA